MQASNSSKILGILVPRPYSLTTLCRGGIGLVVLATAMGCVCVAGAVSADCIDYGDYLHWVGGVDTPGNAAGVAVSGSYAYVADYTSGLQVIKITNPVSPQIVGSVDTPSAASAVAISGTHAYVADGASGLQVIDVANPASPQIVGSVDTPDEAGDVAISGTHAYVADDASGLQVIDVTNPASPQIVGSVDTPGYAWGVAVSGTYAYVAHYTSGLQVIDVANPASPQIVGSMDTPGEAWDVTISGSYAYVADYMSGLQILPAQCGRLTCRPAQMSDPEVPSTLEPRIPADDGVCFGIESGTTFIFALAEPSDLTLAIYDVQGRLVRTMFEGPKQSGDYVLTWDGRSGDEVSVSPGLYFVHLQVGDRVVTRKIVLVR